MHALSRGVLSNRGSAENCLPSIACLPALPAPVQKIYNSMILYLCQMHGARGDGAWQ